MGTLAARSDIKYDTSSLTSFFPPTTPTLLDLETDNKWKPDFPSEFSSVFPKSSKGNESDTQYLFSIYTCLTLPTRSLLKILFLASSEDTTLSSALF